MNNKSKIINIGYQLTTIIIELMLLLLLMSQPYFERVWGWD
jgi:hypothetical protein